MNVPPFFKRPPTGKTQINTYLLDAIGEFMQTGDRLFLQVFHFLFQHGTKLCTLPLDRSNAHLVKNLFLQHRGLNKYKERENCLKTNECFLYVALNIASSDSVLK